TEDAALHVGCVRADGAAECLARTGDVRDARADQPTGQRFRDTQRPTPRVQLRQYRVLHGLVVDTEHEITEDRSQLALLFGHDLARGIFVLALGGDAYDQALDASS